jgi:hypothetical protein
VHHDHLVQKHIYRVKNTKTSGGVKSIHLQKLPQRRKVGTSPLLPALKPRINADYTKLKTGKLLVVRTKLEDGDFVMIQNTYYNFMALYKVSVSQFKGLDAGFSPQRPEFKPGCLHVRFVVDEVSLEQVFLQVLRFPGLIIIHHGYIFLYHSLTRCATS